MTTCSRLKTEFCNARTQVIEQVPRSWPRFSEWVKSYKTPPRCGFFCSSSTMRQARHAHSLLSRTTRETTWKNCWFCRSSGHRWRTGRRKRRKTLSSTHVLLHFLAFLPAPSTFHFPLDSAHADLSPPEFWWTQPLHVRPPILRPLHAKPRCSFALNGAESLLSFIHICTRRRKSVGNLVQP